MLSSNIKGVTNGFPLRIQVEKVVEKQVEINHDFLRNIFPKIHWKAFSDASRIMGYNQLPEEPPEPSVLESDVDFLVKFHHALLELHLEEGALLCPETGRKFPVSKGIPNMLLLEGEASGFLAIASSESTTCGVREVDLVLDCWGANKQSLPDYSPPLQLCAQVSALQDHVPVESLLALCAQNESKICLPCGTSCSGGYFPSSTCNANADRMCTSCSLCQDSSCWDVCGVSSESQQQQQLEIKKLVVIIGSSLLSCLLILVACIFSRIFKVKSEGKHTIQCCFCIGKPVAKADPDPNPLPLLSLTAYVGETQVHRLSELKDATHGFKELSELGREGASVLCIKLFFLMLGKSQSSKLMLLQ
ncbi:hypothetical protein V6N13_012666 [Hibiscus sabdariffa]